MPDMNTPQQESTEKRPFIREKIARPPMTRRQLVKRMAVCLFIAVLAGASAGAGFAVARPLAEKYLVAQPTRESVSVTIPKDDPESSPAETMSGGEESSPVEPESGTEDGTAEETAEGTEETAGESPESVQETEETETSTEEETQPLREVIQEVIDAYEYSYSAKDINALYGILYSVVREADKGVVEVHSLRQETDWFDNPVERAGLFAGVVIASTGQELLILTPDRAVENADSIKVTFRDGAQTDGMIKGTDPISGMAIVSVDTGQMEESTLLDTAVLKLGNSYSARQGDLVAAVGAPVGLVHSSAYGSISYVVRNVQVADGAARLLYTDIRSDAGSGTFLVNMEGEIIGWASEAYDEDGTQNFTVAMGISDYKPLLEKMSNGQPIPYLGIYGQEVSASMTERGIPAGVYVTDCVPEGPAYNAGIQNGDIIVRVGNQDIVTIKDYQNQVEALNQDSVVTVVVQRQGIEEYKELEYQVTAGAR